MPYNKDEQENTQSQDSLISKVKEATNAIKTEAGIQQAKDWVENKASQPSATPVTTDKKIGGALSKVEFDESGSAILPEKEVSHGTPGGLFENAINKLSSMEESAKTNPSLYEKYGRKPTTQEEDTAFGAAEVKRQNKEFKLDKHAWADTEGTTGKKRNETNPDDDAYHWDGHTDENGNWVSGLDEWADDNQARINSGIERFNKTIDDNKYLTEAEVQAEQQEWANLYYDSKELEEYAQTVVDDFKAKYDQTYASASEEDKKSMDAELARLEGNQQVYKNWQDKSKEMYDKWSGLNTVYDTVDDNKKFVTDEGGNFLASYYEENGVRPPEVIQEDMDRVKAIIDDFTAESLHGKFGSTAQAYVSSLKTEPELAEAQKEYDRLAQEKEAADYLTETMSEVNDSIDVRRSKYLFAPDENGWDWNHIKEGLLEDLDKASTVEERAAIQKELNFVNSNIEYDKSKEYKEAYKDATPEQINDRLLELTYAPNVDVSNASAAGESVRKLKSERREKYNAYLKEKDPTKKDAIWADVKELDSRIATAQSQKKGFIEKITNIIDFLAEPKSPMVERELTDDEKIEKRVLQEMQWAIKDEKINSIKDDLYAKNPGKDIGELWASQASGEKQQARKDIKTAQDALTEAAGDYNNFGKLRSHTVDLLKDAKLYDDVIKLVGGESVSKDQWEDLQSEWAEYATGVMARKNEAYFDKSDELSYARNLEDQELKRHKDYNAKVERGKELYETVVTEAVKQFNSGAKKSEVISTLVNGGFSEEDAKSWLDMLGLFGVDTNAVTPSIEGVAPGKVSLFQQIFHNTYGAERGYFTKDQINGFYYRLGNNDLTGAAKKAAQLNSDINTEFKEAVARGYAGVGLAQGQALKADGILGRVRGATMTLGTSASSFATSLASPVEAVYNMAQLQKLGQTYSKESRSLHEESKLVSQYGMNINRGTGIFKKDSWNDFFYNVEESTIHSLLAIATGSAIAEALPIASLPGVPFLGKTAAEAFTTAFVDLNFAGNAYLDTFNELKQAGVDENLANSAAVLSGIAEAFFEHFSVENLVHMKTPRTALQFFRNACLQGPIEMSEELATGVANKVTNYWLLGEDSDYHKQAEKYARTYHITMAEAEKMVRHEFIREVALEGVAGLISGFASAAGRGAQFILTDNSKAGKAMYSGYGELINKELANGKNAAQMLGEYLKDYEFIPEGQEKKFSPEDKDTIEAIKQFAEKVAGGNATNEEIGRMYKLLEQYDPGNILSDFAYNNPEFATVSLGAFMTGYKDAMIALFGPEKASQYMKAFNKMVQNAQAGLDYDYVANDLEVALHQVGAEISAEDVSKLTKFLANVLTGDESVSEKSIYDEVTSGLLKDTKVQMAVWTYLQNRIANANDPINAAAAAMRKAQEDVQKQIDAVQAALDASTDDAERIILEQKLDTLEGQKADLGFAAMNDSMNMTEADLLAVVAPLVHTVTNVNTGNVGTAVADTLRGAWKYINIGNKANRANDNAVRSYVTNKLFGRSSLETMAKYRDDGDFFVAKGPDGKDHIFTREYYIQQHKKGIDPLTGQPSAFKDLVDTDEKLNAEFDGQIRSTLGAGGLADMVRYNLRTGEEKTAEQTQRQKEQIQDIMGAYDVNANILRNEIKEIDRQLQDLYTQAEMAKASNEPLPEQHDAAVKNLEERKAKAEADLKIIQERSKVRSNGRIQTHDSGTSGRNAGTDERRNAGGIPYSGTGSNSGGSGVQADGGRGSESGNSETLREQEVILKDGDDAVATMDNGTVIYDSDDPNANTDKLTSEEKDVLQMAKEAGVDRLIFVDADQLWGDGNRAAGYYVIIGGKKIIIVNSNRGTVNGYHEAMHYCLDSYTKEEKRSILDEFVAGVFKSGDEFASLFNLYNNEIHQKVYEPLYKAFKNGNKAPYYYALYEEMLCDLWHGLNRYHIPDDQFKPLQQRTYAFVVQKQIVEHAADKAKQSKGEKQETKESKNPLIKFLTGERKPNDVLESLHGNLAYKVRFLGDEREGDHSTARYSLFVKDADDKYHKVGEFYADEIGTELSKQEAEFRHKYGLGIAVPGDTWAGVLKRIEDIRGSKKAPETHGGIPRAETPETQEAPKVQETPKAERTVEEQKAEEFFDFLVRQSDDFDLDPFITAASDARLQYISGLEGASDAEKQVIAAVKKEVERRQAEDKRVEEENRPKPLDTSVGEARLAQVRETVRNLSTTDLMGMMREVANLLNQLSSDNPDRIILEPVARILIDEYTNRLSEKGTSKQEGGAVISDQPAVDLPPDNPTGKAGEAKVDPEYRGDTEETEESDTEEDTGNPLKDELVAIEKEIQEIEDNIKDMRKDRDQQIKNESDKDMRDLIKGQANDAIKYWKDQVDNLKKRATAIRSQLLKENKRNKNENRGSVIEANSAKGSKKKPKPSASTHIDNRNLGNVGKTNVNAFQYDNPEVKPFFKRAAEILMHDLMYLQTTRRNEYDKGTFFESETDFLAAVRSNFKSIDDAVAACEAVIYDKGAENYVGPKRIEIFLDQMLTNGYTPINLDSETIEPDMDYINLKGSLEGGTPFDARQKAIDDLRLAYLEDGLTDEELGKIVDENKARTGYYDPYTRDGLGEATETTTETEPETTEQPEQTGRTVSEIDAEMDDVSAEIESLMGQIENAPNNVSEDKYAELNERLRDREAYYDTLQAEWKDAYATGRFSVDESYSPTIPDLYGKFSVESLANGTGFETLYQSVKTGKLTTLEDWIRDIQNQPREPGKEMPTRDSLQEEFSRKVKYGEARVYGVARRNPDETLTEMHVETITSEDMRNSPLGFLIACAEENGRISKEEAERQYDFLRDLTRMLFHYHDEGLIWEVVGSEMFAAIKSNSDPQYNRTIDFSTICKKTQAVIDAVGMTMQLLDTGLSKDEIKLVYKLVGEAGESTPCPVCYVFSRWMGLGSVLDNIKRYQQLYGETTPGGKEKVLELVKEVQRAAEAKMEGTDLTFGKAVNAAQKDVELRLKVAESAFNDYEKALKNPNAKKYKGRNITTDENGNPRSQDYWAEQISSLAKEYDKFDAYKWAVKTRLINADLLVKNSEAVAAKLARMGIEGETLNEILENAKNSNNDDEDFVALWDELQSNLTDLEIVDEDRLKELHRKQELRKQQSSLKAAVTREFGKDFTNSLKKLSAIEQALEKHPDSVALKNLYENRKEFDAIGEEYVFRKGYRDVPDDILFDLNQGEKFARYYPATWSYRTTRGSGLGKAIMPYSDARVGEIIQGMAVSDVKNIQIGKDKNAFLNLVLPEKREEARKILATARKKMAAQNLIGGMRFQSTSDFRYEYASDYLMAFFEMQAMGANVQLYTKVLEAVDFFANVGCDVNLSVMPRDKGIGELTEKPADWDTNYDRYFTRKNNKYVRLKKGDVAPKFVPGKYHAILYSDVTGVNGGAAREYVQKYDNVQMIMVGISADHINACLDSDDITFVIPFHGSGNSTKDIQQLMQLLGETIDAKNITDFSSYQTDTEKEKNSPARNLRKKIVSGGCLINGRITLTTEEANILERNVFLKDLFRRFYLDATDRNGRVDRTESEKNRQNITILNVHDDGTTSVNTDFSIDFGKANDQAFAKKYYLDDKNECYGNFLSGITANQIFPYEYWDKSLKQSEAKGNGDAFQEYCKSLGLIPRFSGWAKGKYSAKNDFTKNDNYWKLLIDRKMYDNQGNYRAQRQIDLSNIDAFRHSDESYEGDRRIAVTDLNPNYGQVTFGNNSPFANRVNPKVNNKRDNSVISKINDPRKTNAIATIATKIINEARGKSDSRAKRRMFADSEDIRQAIDAGDYITAAHMLIDDPGTRFFEENGTLYVETDEGVMRVEKNGDLVPVENTTEQAEPFMDDYDTDGKFSVDVTDPDELAWLNKLYEDGDVVFTYKSYLEYEDEDGIYLIAPMAGLQKDEKGNKRLSHKLRPMHWEKSIGNPNSKNIKKNKKGKWEYHLEKSDADSPVDAAYNPYQHSGDLAINDQFAIAYRRPQLVTYICAIPKSELEGKYHYGVTDPENARRADGEIVTAKDPVGILDWKTGAFGSQLFNSKRHTYLSRWLMPIQRLSDEEVARQYKEIVDREPAGLGVPFNVVTQNVRNILEDMGVPIDITGTGIREDLYGAYLKDVNEQRIAEGKEPYPYSFIARTKAEKDAIKKRREAEAKKMREERGEEWANYKVGDLNSPKSKDSFATAENKNGQYRIDFDSAETPTRKYIDKRNGKYSADDEQMASTLQMYEDLVDPSEWKASEHQNMNERMYNRISNGISLWDKVVSFYDTVDEDNYNWLSYEDITQAMRINPYNGNVDGEDMPLASEVMWSLLHLARDRGSDVKERIYRLMEEIAPHLMRTEQDKWIRPVSSRFPPIDFDFSNWYNERNPMPEVGYTPKPLEQLHQEAIEATNEADFQRRAYRRSLATEDEYNRAAEKARRAWNMYNTRFNAEQGKGKFSVDIDPDAAFDSFGYEVELDDYSPVVTQSDLSDNLYYSEDGNTAYYQTDSGETVVLNNVGTDSPEARYIEYLEAINNANNTNTTATKPYIIPPANRNGNDGYNINQPNAGLRRGAEEVLTQNQERALRSAGSNGELYAEGVSQSEETQGVRYSADEESPGARYSTMYDADSDTFVNEKGETVATDDMYPIGSFTREIFKAMKSGDQSLKNVEDIINKLLDRNFNLYEEDVNTVRRMIQINDAYTPEQRKAMMDAMDKLVKKHGKMRSAKEDKNQDIHFAVQRDQGDTIDDPNHKGKKITRKEFVKRATEGKDPFTGEDSDTTMTEKEANELFDKQGTVIMKFTQTVARNSDKEWLTAETVRMALTDESMSYTPVPNDKAIRLAEERFRKAGSYEKALAEWDGIVHSERTPKQVDVAYGELLLQKAVDQGRINDTVKLVSDLTLMAHTTGQTLQAFRILKKLTPRGQLYYLQSVVDDLNKRYDSRIRDGKMGRVTLNQGLVELLLASSTREELDNAVDLIKKDLAKQIPATWADQWNAWRYLAMLGNPRTHFRNLFGNAAFMPMVFVKDMIARRLENKYVDPNLRMRIAGADLSKNSVYRQRAEQDFQVMRKIIAGEASGNKYSDIQDILGERDVFAWQWLNKLARANGGALTAEDLFFMEKYYTRAFAEALQARGIKEEDVQTFDATPEGRKILNEIRNWATLEAQRDTYHDANKLASLINQMKRSSPAAYVLLEGLAPFTKTPANILKRGIEYSPIGLISSCIQLNRDLKNGEYSTSQCIDRFAAGLTGSLFMALGFILGHGLFGIKLRGGGPDDKKEGEFEKLQGHQAWSIEIGNFSYTLDWMAPTALPLFIGQGIYSMLKRGGFDYTDMDTWMILTRLADPLLSLSMLDGIENTLTSLSNAQNTSALGVLWTSMAGSYIAQGMPTIFGQAARIVDPYRRQTFVAEDEKSSAMKKWVQSSIQAKLPGFGRFVGVDLIPSEENKKLYVDMWGRTKDSSSLPETLWRIAENFISPGYHSWINETPVDAELQRLYEATEDKSALPTYLQKSINNQSIGKDDEGNEIVIDGKKLNADEMTKYEMTVGQNRYQLLSDIFASPEYQAATDTEKLKMVDDAYKYAKDLGDRAIIPEREHDSHWMEVAEKIGASDYIVLRQEYEDNKSNEKIFSWLASNPNLTEDQVATLIADKFNPPDNVSSISSDGFLYDLNGSDEDAIKEINAQIIQDGLKTLLSSEEYKNAPDKDVMLKQFYEDSRAETLKVYGEMLDQTDRVKYIGKAASIGAESFSKVLDLTTADVKGDYRNNIEAQSSWLGYKYKADTSINNPLHEGYSIELDKTQRSRLESKFRDRWNAAYDELLHSEKFQNAPSREYQEDMIARRFNQVSTEVENEYAAELYQAGGYSETFGKPGSFTWSKAYEIADRELSTPQERGEWLAGKYSPGSSIDDPDQAAYEIPLTTEDKNQLKKEFASAYVPRYVKMVTSAEFKALDPTTQEYKKEELRKDVAKSVQEAYARKLKADGYASVAFDDKANLANKYEYLASNELSDAEKIQIIKDSYVGGTIANAEARGYRKKMFDEWMDNPANTKSYLEQNTADSYKKMREAADKYAGKLTKQKYGNVKNYSDIEDFDLYDVYYTTNNPIDSTPPVKINAPATSKTDSGALLKPGNIDLNARPIERNSDGTYSTVDSVTWEVDGQFVNVPTVIYVDGEEINGEWVEGWVHVDGDTALDHYFETGEHLGIYSDKESAVKAAQQLSKDQAKQYDSKANFWAGLIRH